MKICIESLNLRDKGIVFDSALKINLENPAK